MRQWAAFSAALLTTAALLVAAQAAAQLAPSSTERPSEQKPSLDAEWAKTAVASEQARSGDASLHPREDDFFARFLVGYSRVRFFDGVEVGVKEEDVGTSFRRAVYQDASAWGIRAEIGEAHGDGEGFAVAPRAALAVARVSPESLSTEIIGVDHRWRISPWWWSVSGGVELQMIRRHLLLGADLGLAGVTVTGEPLAPDSLVVETYSTYGIHGRLAAGYRASASPHLAIGALGAIEGFDWLFREPGSQVGVSAFLEWDGGRR